MKYVPRKERASVRRAKSSRATEQGIAGHQAAMKAAGNAAGWDSSIGNTGPFETTRYAVSTKTKEVFVPGQGNVMTDSAFPEHSGVSRQETTSYRTGKRKGEI